MAEIKNQIKRQQSLLVQQKRGAVTGINTVDQTSGKLTFFDLAVKKSEISQTEAKIERLKNDFKELEALGEKCLSLCGEKFPANGPVGAIGLGGLSLPATQIIDSNNLLIGSVGGKEWWLRRSTAGIVNDAPVAMPDFVRVAGTAQFGGVTHYVFESCSDAVMAAWRDRHPAKPVASSRK